MFLPRLAIAAVLLSCLAACGQNDDATPPDTTPAAPATALPAAPGSSALPAPASSALPATAASTANAQAAGLTVEKLTLGSAIGDDYTVSKAKDTFAPGDRTIYAAVSTEGAVSNATLAAKWTYQDGQTVSDIAQSITTEGPATTTFKIHNPNDWPPGNYKVAISLDGKAVAKQDFEVAKR